jgi:hypothetical protein
MKDTKQLDEQLVSLEITLTNLVTDINAIREEIATPVTEASESDELQVRFEILWSHMKEDGDVYLYGEDNYYSRKDDDSFHFYATATGRYKDSYFSIDVYKTKGGSKLVCTIAGCVTEYPFTVKRWLEENSDFEFEII